MPGPVKQFIDYSNNTNSDTGENNAASILPYTNTEDVVDTVLNRPGESLRQRTEAVRNVEADSLYLRDADRSLILSGPGLVSWPGSTTASASGIPTISDTLWILPMLTPGFAQSAPVPPIASSYGVLHLLRASDSMASIVVTSQRRSYAGGDRINVVVSAGVSFSCTLDVEANYQQRTIKIVAVTGTTTLTTVINALNALTPLTPDNTALVTAALENGAIGSDLLLTTQAKQFVAGNYDGEGHAITPANLAAFFSGNPGSVLAEGDTLCAAFSMVADPAGIGGRRQATPENSNTAIVVGSYFNSRVNPEKLVNALPICKVVHGALVFSTGIEVPAGGTNLALSNVDTTSRVVRNGGFEYGVTSATGRYSIVDWENRVDLATNGAWRLGTTSPPAGAKCLELNKTSTVATVVRLEQAQEIPVTPGQFVRVTASVQQLIAPTAGTYSVVLYWGDLDSGASGSTTVPLQALATTDGSPRLVDQTIAVPSGKRTLKLVTIEAAGVTSASTGVALRVDSVQVALQTLGLATKSVDDARLGVKTVDGVIIEDPAFALGQLAALLRFDKGTLTNEGQLIGERKDQTYSSSSLPPALAWLGRLYNLGGGLTHSAAQGLLARIGTPFYDGANITLLWESVPASELGGAIVNPSMRVYMTLNGDLWMTINAVSDTAMSFTKDDVTQGATLFIFGRGVVETRFRAAAATGSWTTWTKQAVFTGSEITTMTLPSFAPQLSMYDNAGNRRVVRDHNGMPGGRTSEIRQEWLVNVPEGWATGNLNGGTTPRATTARGNVLELSTTSTSGSVAQMTLAGLIFPGAGMANMLVTMEWEFDVTALASASPGAEVQMGFHADWDGGGAHNVFAKVDGNANWQLDTDTHFGPNVVDTGVVAAGVQRFRLEVYGSAHPGSQRVLAYINGALVAQDDAFDDDVTAGFIQVRTTAGTTKVTAVSPVHLTYTRVLTDDAL